VPIRADSDFLAQRETQPALQQYYINNTKYNTFLSFASPNVKERFGFLYNVRYDFYDNKIITVYKQTLSQNNIKLYRFLIFFRFEETKRF